MGKQPASYLYYKDVNRAALLSSPTGSGKTLAAFLAVFDFLARARVGRSLRLSPGGDRSGLHGRTSLLAWRALAVSSPASSAYYSASLEDFVVAETRQVVGDLTLRSQSVEETQRDAWATQVRLLQQSLSGIRGTVFFEFVVPRIGSRIDAVVIAGPAILVLEFKVGAQTFERSASDQVWDYALDLKNFHLGSHDAPIIPILVATDAPVQPAVLPVPHPDNVYRPVYSNADGLRTLIEVVTRDVTGITLDAIAWGRAPYRPTPTIIEAAQALYANHSVEAITRNDAGADNLAYTSGRVEHIVDEARAKKHHAIVFITGVPGAGKTLVGLNLATKRRDAESPTHAVFLSGNDPLVKVLREALTRDEVARLRLRGQRKSKKEVGQPIKSFIQNVHHFRDEGLRNDLPPTDHVVIFDEAQRAWDKAKTADFMWRKKGRPDFDQSEPEFLISYLDRHRDWAVVVCLVGGGQEINWGEAGISAWLDAAREKFPHWHVYVSANLMGSEYQAKIALDQLATRAHLNYDKGLHLSVSMRSFRAEHVSAFVHALLECEEERARELFRAVQATYPIVVTRDLDRAKCWVREHARASERIGLVASSAAHRLKPHAIDIRVSVDPVHWFLNGDDDPRSSMYLEDAATEFQVQGLELDWACVTWDADLRFVGSGWNFHSYVGANWQRVKKEERRRYLKNAYRVLLTRARQGMAIFVPPGNAGDATRPPEFYDETFAYLSSLGLAVL